MSSVAKGFNCFAAAAAVVPRCQRKASLLEGDDWYVTDGDVERLVVDLGR